MLIGRERECALLVSLLDRARRSEGSALVISGEPGIGKSALIRWATEQAEGMRVLAARGLESESELAFGGLSLLLRPVLPLIEALPPRQRDALAAALSVGPGAVADRFSVYAATLDLLAAVSDESPLLVTVDDIHWFDTGSREALAFAARRLGSESALMLFATRSEHARRLDVADLPDIALTGLAEDAAVAVVDSGGVHLSAAVARRLSAATGGNPLALVELPALLTTAQRVGTEPLPDPLPAGRRVEAAFGRRLDRLPAGIEAALLVAAASDSGDLGEVEPAIAELGLDPAALQGGEAAGLVHLHPPQVSFRHPLIRSAVYHRATDGERRAAHRALAATLTSAESGRRAWHLAAAAPGPDEAVARELEALAGHSVARAAPLSAARALEAAARLSPKAPKRARRLHEAGRQALLGGRSDDALRLLDRAFPLADHPRLRIEIEHLQCLARLFDPGVLPEIRERLLALAARLEDEDPAEATLIRTEVMFTYGMGAEPGPFLELAESALPSAKRAGGSTHAVAMASYGYALALAGRAGDARDTLAAAESLLADHPPDGIAWLAAGRGEAWTFAGDPDRGRALLTTEIEDARRRSALTMLPLNLAQLCVTEFRRGEWLAASAAGSESKRLAEELGQESELGYTCAALGRVEAGQGRESSSRALLARSAAISKACGATALEHVSLAAFGFLELGLGHTEPACDVLARVTALDRERGLTVEGDQALPDLVEAYVRAGRRAEAEGALATLEHEAARTDTRWARAVTARCRGLLADEEGFEDDFAAALAEHDRMTATFERARTELCFGERLRRARRRIDARERLHDTLAAFDAIGAAPWAARARAELELAGERLPKPTGALPSLTPQELQVALKVSEGATNREAASALFVTVKTIEAHLRSIYRKLGVRSRAELTRLVLSKGETSGFSSMR
jgi:DNA-binding CsgD family transcriptional regulator